MSEDPLLETRKELELTTDHKELILYIDGVARGNPGEGGIGIIIKNQDGKVLEEIGGYIGETTNNYAEYTALVTALKAALRYKPSKVTVYSDSQLLVRQINGLYRVKSQNLIPLYKEGKDIISKIGNVMVLHIPREKNKEADVLANKGVDLKIEVNI